MDKFETQEKIDRYYDALDALLDVHDLYQDDKYRKAINDLRDDICEMENHPNSL